MEIMEEILEEVKIIRCLCETMSKNNDKLDFESAKKLIEEYPAKELQIAVSPKRAAKMLDLSPRTIYRWLERGEIQSFKIGNNRRILVSELEALVERALDRAQ